MCPSIMAGIIMGGITMAEQADICMATITPSRSLTPVVPVHWAELPVPWDAA
jgi:phage terminase large subunit-like protein